MKGQHRYLLLIEPVAGYFATLGEEDEAVGAIPVLDHIQAFVDSRRNFSWGKYRHRKIVLIARPSSARAF
ncbi:hypothetical protein AJ87_08310 [Rhizobium yanglingense]|nr:hypothetical protein AJ87_08310 [Rhizobium yanglingense]